MKISYGTIVLAAFGLTLTSFSDLWTYDFGTDTGTHSSGVSTTFVPAPASGTDYIRIGTGGGSFTLANPGDVALGSGTELQGVASSSASVNKFSVFDWASPTPEVYFKTSLKLSGGSSGTWSLFLGDGISFSNANAFTSAQTFTALQLIFGASGAITENYRNGGSWSALPDAFSQDTVYTIELFGNNRTTDTNYVYGLSTYSLAAGKVDLWVDGVLVSDELNKGALGAGANVDSFMFYGDSSSGNVANIALDDIVYANSLNSIPEPATLGLVLMAAATLLGLRRKQYG